MENTQRLIDLMMLSSEGHDSAALRAAHHVGGTVVGLDRDDVSGLKRMAPPSLGLQSFASLTHTYGKPRPVFLSFRLAMHLLERQTRLDNILDHWNVRGDMIVNLERLVVSQEQELRGMGREMAYHRKRLGLLLSVPGVLDVPGVSDLLDKWGMGPDGNISGGLT